MAHEKFPLQQMIKSLRLQLEQAIVDGQQSDLRFEVGTIELELKVVATSEAGVDGGLGWSILKFGAKSSEKDENVHTLRLTLAPRTKVGETLSLSGKIRD
jgi:hypothetical protein